MTSNINNQFIIEEFSKYKWEIKIDQEILLSFSTLDSVYEHFKKEVEYWEKKDPSSQQLVFWKNKQILDELSSIINSDPHQNRNRFSNFMNHFQNLIKNSHEICIISYSPQGKLYESQNSDDAKGVLDYYSNKFKSTNNFIYMPGYLKAFLLDNSNIFKTDLPDFFKQSNIHLKEIMELKSLEADIVNKKIKNLEESSKNLQKDFASKLNEYTETQNKLHTEYLEKFNNLEDVYKNKLRIEGPSSYWEKLSIDHSKKGLRWMFSAIGSGLLSIGVLICIFFNYPKEFLSEGFNFDFNVLKGTILVAIIVSILVYLTRFFIKLSLSSFHLSLDAKERLQLSHFYLALLKEDATMIDKTKDLVLQSLFARADTGLLHHDSNPTLPVSFSGLSKQNPIL